MPALISNTAPHTADTWSSSSDSSYVSTVTELSTPTPDIPPQVISPTPCSNPGKKKSQRKRKKVNTNTEKVTLPPPPPPVIESAPTLTSTSYADMLRKPQPLSLILSECSSESDLVTSNTNTSSENSQLHSSCPNLSHTWQCAQQRDQQCTNTPCVARPGDYCPATQCPPSCINVHNHIEFLNESNICPSEKLPDSVISIVNSDETGNLQSVFDQTQSTRKKESKELLITNNQNREYQTSLRSYTIHNHQSLSVNHQKLINYFSKEWRKIPLSSIEKPMKF